MRGGAQAHLVEAGDGYCYVIKATNNPQHRRILVNEWIAGCFLRYLQIRAPEVAVVELPPSLLEQEPELHLLKGKTHVPIPPGWHFGSRYPGHPERSTVYDYLPDALLPNVVNLRDFAGAMVFDKWIGNSDARQCVFYRAHQRQPAAEEAPIPSRPGFVASMIDHGFVFQGPHWRLDAAPRHGIYARPAVYARIAGWQDFEPWIGRIEHFPEEQMDLAMKGLPPEWVAGDEAALEDLLALLLERRGRIRHIVEDTVLRLGTEWFPAWR